MKFKHLSLTQFADWLRGTPKPAWATLEEWSAWESKAKKKKIRYWIVETGLDLIGDFFLFPFRQFGKMRWYLKNCFITKSHSLTSNLKRGQWYDLDHRILHCLFDELVNFVEVEEAWMYVICGDKPPKFPTISYFRRYFNFRNPEAGLAYLEWASNLAHDEEWFDKNSEDYQKPTSQALAALEIISLYKWWKEERPNRPDPMDASGLSKIFEERKQKAIQQGEDPFWSTFQAETPEKEDEMRKASNLHHKMEQDFSDEDTAMLIRLIKIRESLWT